MTIFLIPTRTTDRSSSLARLETVLVPMLIGRADERNGGFDPSNDNRASGPGSRSPSRLPVGHFGT